MRHTLLALLASALLLLASCSTRTDENGDLGGMWQLVARRAADGTVMTNAPVVYYRIQFSLMQLTPLHNGVAPFSHFLHTPDSLILLDAFDNTQKDSVRIPFADLTDYYGVPANGRFRIDLLDADVLHLSSAAGTLRFRKY
ncbi:MAG: lipocalin-like domain-containing protein [Bacteroidaceae bacterium]|nr:lipocalin-like domain-containing protein [Bacteroidaceae bacterium]